MDKGPTPGLVEEIIVSDKNVVVISPVSLLEQFSTRHHLVLTQYYLRYPGYAEFYRDRRRAGDFIILDNGAAELKESITVGDIMKVANELHPNLVVAPDTIYNMEATLHSTAIFIGVYARMLADKQIGIMAVPQGSNRVEWEACYNAFNENPAVSWLGISMFYTPKFDKRLEALKVIAPTVQKPCHLLGLWNNPYDLLEERKFDFVKSVDTAKPIEFALEGLTLEQWTKHKHIDDDWYFGTAGRSLGPEGFSTVELMTTNVEAYKRIFEEGVC